MSLVGLMQPAKLGKLVVQQVIVFGQCEQVIAHVCTVLAQAQLANVLGLFKIKPGPNQWIVHCSSPLVASICSAASVAGAGFICARSLYAAAMHCHCPCTHMSATPAARTSASSARHAIVSFSSATISASYCSPS